MKRNTGFVNIGTSHETAEFALKEFIDKYRIIEYLDIKPSNAYFFNYNNVTYSYGLLIKESKEIDKITSLEKTKKDLDFIEKKEFKLKEKEERGVHGQFYANRRV